MLNRVSGVRHAVVAVGVLGVSALGALGVVGAGDQALFRSEHFDAKQVIVSPAGVDHPGGVAIREVVDIDFGVTERRGYQRIIPNDFGVPIDVSASSPDANERLDVVQVGADTRIRIGDPNTTFTGQHRYVLEYTLPAAGVDTGLLALDIIGNDETFQTDSFTVEVVGFELSDPTCDTGLRGNFGGCELEQFGDDRYVSVIEPLEPGEGITISGTIDAVSAEPTDVADAPLPERNPTGLQLLGLVQLVLGAATAVAVFFAFRARGSNEVFGGGVAAEAAFGPGMTKLPVPSPGDPFADVPTHRVPDGRLAELSTIEFSPPRGIEPWQGNVLLREKVDDETVSAWFSEMVAREAIEITGSGKQMVLRPGQTTARLHSVDRGHLIRLFAQAPAVELGTYDKNFATVWKGVASEQRRLIDDSGWWSRPLGLAGSVSAAAIVLAVIGGFVAFGLFSAGLLALVTSSWGGPAAVAALTVLVIAILAGLMYQSMLASRTATGSALTLRTESFRRFLEASEGRHVDWAWEQGLIREYSAWAVALGEAAAWSDAIKSSNIEQPERITAPMLIYANASMFRSSHTAPSSSGGSGGFSGGVGGGGGGGSSGSW
ncbi:DUF2207 domain-containing protein [bacterium]|nr:DUF2207 domain-containing protein [bacterium]